jgi:hypothetical protein
MQQQKRERNKIIPVKRGTMAPTRAMLTAAIRFVSTPGGIAVVVVVVDGACVVPVADPNVLQFPVTAIKRKMLLMTSSIQIKA